MKLEVKNNIGQVYYTGEYKDIEGWFEAEWKGYVSADEVITAAKQVMETFADLKFNKQLNDSSKGEGSWDEANPWLQQYWLPFAIGNGLRKFAFIVSEDVFSAMSTDEFSTILPEIGFEMRTFANRKEAAAWLKSA